MTRIDDDHFFMIIRIFDKLRSECFSDSVIFCFCRSMLAVQKLCYGENIDDQTRASFRI